MSTEATVSLDIPRGILRDLASLSNSKKIDIIKFLVNSLHAEGEKVENEKDHTRRMLNKHAGKWAGSESPEEIINIVREHASIREPLTF